MLYIYVYPTLYSLFLASTKFFTYIIAIYRHNHLYILLFKM